MLLPVFSGGWRARLIRVQLIVTACGYVRIFSSHNTVPAGVKVLARERNARFLGQVLGSRPAVVLQQRRLKKGGFNIKESNKEVARTTERRSPCARSYPFSGCLRTRPLSLVSVTRQARPWLIHHRPCDASAERAALSPPEGHICASSGGGTLHV